MARKVHRHSDGSEEIWDSETGRYTHLDSDGVEVEDRPLTKPECETLDPTTPAVRQLNEVVDQLILDMLMGGM